MKCTTKVKVTELFPEQNALLTREVASQLFQRVEMSPCYDVKLDFEGIHFISRSFADQFHKEKVAMFERGEKEIVVENAESDVFQMFQAVSKTQNESNRTYRHYKVIDLSSRRFTKHYLSSIL